MQVVILAAGQGKRMRSDLAKVLHPLAGRPLLSHVIDTARHLTPARLCIVVGHGAQEVRERVQDTTIEWVVQERQLGTGHAVMQAMPRLEGNATVLILYGDVPLIAPGTLRSLVDAASSGHLALLTQEVDDPKGYGRIVRDGSGRVARIVEEKDASSEERAIREVNTGIIAAPRAKLAQWLARLGNDNAQGEYYLTDIVALAVADGVPVEVRHPASASECLGVNSKVELAALERRYQMNQAARLLEAGVTLADPARIDVRGNLECGRDVSIDVNCIFEGHVVLANGVRIGANCILRDVTLGKATEVKPFTMIEEATIGANARIGPYARIRPDTKLADDVHVGNFVEVKASTFGRGSKANHLAYVGDST
ncbi:MAG TPA: bifunctional UDP-N-acetylglucosamine diphosphorylase/glucosamine-1-phosphate N-acetyltransferase GlmU, partial [Usitatibacter sp.]|nr:bifunctional UDP-N-acetylglucosamine diphosphorylase/glucosamine-1-phosphate N-acetyltransferase GlmU [Usitatibacter sp.]